VIRAVLDSNILIAALPAVEGPLARIVLAWQEGDFELVTSEYILAEVDAACRTPYWHRHVTPNQVLALLELVRQDATSVVVPPTIGRVAPHYHDDPILATAIEGGAPWLVTGDLKLQLARQLAGISIVSPRRFLEILDDEKLGG
jgi:putative PIN family toxin of toxin-antitoxin system